MLRSIRSDPRWHDFVARYRDEFTLFAEEACMIVPTGQQIELFTEIGRPDEWVSVSSGTGTGKSSGTAILILCFLMTYPDSRVCLTANKVQQVQIGVFKYIKTYFKTITKQYPWLEDYFTLTDTNFYANESKGIWEVVIKGYRVGQEESLAGEHAEHMLYIVDEASGLGDKAFEKITGTLTQDDNRLLLLSQPTRNEGFFYRSHHDLKRVEGKPTSGTFVALRFNSEDSPLVKTKFILAKYLEYGGRDSAEYMVRVLGEFCDHLSGFLISRSLMADAWDNHIEHEEDWGYVVTCDVAGGNWRDSCVHSIGRVSGYGHSRRVEVIETIEHGGGMGAVDFAHYIHEEVCPYYPNLTIAIDAGAMGGEMIKALDRLNVPNVKAINWGANCHAKALRKAYKNKRAYCHAMVRDALRYGNIKLYDGGQRFKDKTIEQFIKLPFFYNESDGGLQLQMLGKDKMKSQGIGSPDIFDTHAFFWMVDYLVVTEGIEEDESHLSDSGGDDIGDAMEELAAL